MTVDEGWPSVICADTAILNNNNYRLLINIDYKIYQFNLQLKKIERIGSGPYQFIMFSYTYRNQR